MDNKYKPKRSKNFTESEKTKLVDLITSSRILLTKPKLGSNHYNTTAKLKEAAWKNILLELNSSFSYQRPLVALKKAWDNLKRDARTQRARIRCQLAETGGGPTDAFEDPLLLKVEAAIGLNSSGLENPFDSNTSAVQNDGSCSQQVSTSKWEEAVQPTHQQESAENVELEMEWTLDENPTFTLPETPELPKPTAPPSVPRKAFKKRLHLVKSAKDSLLSDLQRVAAAKLETERTKREDAQELETKKMEALLTQTDMQNEILQLQKVQAVLQCDLLTMQTAQSKLQLEILGEERIAKAAQSEIQLDILRLERKIKRVALKKLQSECLCSKSTFDST